MDYKIAVIKGDGIGPEIVDATIPALDKVAKEFGHRFKYEYMLAGGAALDEVGEPLPKKTLKKCKECSPATKGRKWRSSGSGRSSAFSRTSGPR